MTRVTCTPKRKRRTYRVTERYWIARGFQSNIGDGDQYEVFDMDTTEFLGGHATLKLAVEHIRTIRRAQ